MIFLYWDDGMIVTCQPLLFRPVALATRSVEVLAAALWVGSGLLWDRLTGGWERNRPQRARQVKTAIERLGAAYIKVRRLS